MKLNQDQERAVGHIYETGNTYLVGQMGSGKTAVALTAACELLRDKVVSRVLVVAPLKVCNEVWSVEAAKWGQGLGVGVCTGAPSERLNVVSGAERILCVNYENLPWMLEQDHGCDMLIVDEVTKMKAGGVQFKALRKQLKLFEVRLVMTGTPVSENWQGLFYPMMIVNSLALGRNKDTFTRQYFHATDYNEYNWELNHDGADGIYARIDSYMVVLPDYADELPDMFTEVIRVDIGQDMDTYKRLEYDMVLGDVTADSAAVLTNKLQQCAAGFLYTDEGETEAVHWHKQAHMDRDSGAGRLIVVYQYTEEMIRARLRFPDAYEVDQLKSFSADPDGVLLLHPKSAGHGIDLTCCAEMLFMGPIWSRDLWTQTIARCWRRGQTSPVRVRVLVSVGTIDETIMFRSDVSKAKYMTELMARLNAPT